MRRNYTPLELTDVAALESGLSTERVTCGVGWGLTVTIERYHIITYDMGPRGRVRVPPIPCAIPLKLFSAGWTSRWTSMPQQLASTIHPHKTSAEIPTIVQHGMCDVIGSWPDRVSVCSIVPPPPRPFPSSWVDRYVSGAFAPSTKRRLGQRLLLARAARDDQGGAGDSRQVHHAVLHGVATFFK